jgi:O-antigen/teichoic acid export membrane protein
LLMAHGVQRALALVLCASVAANLVLSVVLAHVAGLWGVALASLVTDGVASLVAVPLLVRRELNVALRTVAFAVLRPLVAAGVVAVPVLVGLERLLDPQSLSELAVIGIAWVVLGGLAVWRYGFDSLERNAIRRRLLTRRGSALAVS